MRTQEKEFEIQIGFGLSKFTHLENIILESDFRGSYKKFSGDIKN